MIEGLMETLLDTTLEPTTNEIDNELTMGGNETLTLVETKDTVKGKAKGKDKSKTKKRTNQNKKSGAAAFMVENFHVTPFDISNLLKPYKGHAEKMDDMKDGEAILVEQVFPVTTQYGTNYIMRTKDDKKSYWSNKIATIIIQNNYVNFNDQYLAINKVGDKEFHFGYAQKNNQDTENVFI